MASTIGLKALSLISNLFTGAIEAVQTITGQSKKPVDHSWQKPSSNDGRSPCPMLNALANHGYLPRDGKNISLARLVMACKEGINLAPDATLLVGLKALQTSTTRNPFTFHLTDLAKHGVIEHDGSLSRHDISSPTKDNNTFAPEIWATVKAHFDSSSETISIATAARARRARLAAARATNPQFDMSPEQVRFSVLETCLYLRVFRAGAEGGEEGAARRAWVGVLFEQERLPFAEGFERSARPLMISELLELERKVEAATGGSE